MPLARASLVLTGSLLLSLGCSSSTSTTPTTDAGTADTGSADVAVDTGPVDTGPPPRTPQAIYGACRNDAECADGNTCLTATNTGMPSGQCNRECTTDDDCVLMTGGQAVDGYCQPANAGGHRYCARVCVNGIDCERDGYSCLGINAGTIHAVNICIPICTDATCTEGTICDHETNRCRVPGDGGTPPGRTLGQTCVANNDTTATPATTCRSSLCSPQVVPDSQGHPYQTGFNGGSCYTRCILPQGYNSSNIWPMQTLPQSNCPDSAVCWINSTMAEGDIGICLPSCMSNSDCRASEGYECRKQFKVGTHTYTFDNGICTRIDCSVTGHACPTGYMCRITHPTATTSTGQCIPSTM